MTNILTRRLFALLTSSKIEHAVKIVCKDFWGAKGTSISFSEADTLRTLFPETKFINTQ